MRKYRCTEGHDEANSHYTQLLYEHTYKTCFLYEEGVSKTVGKVVGRVLV